MTFRLHAVIVLLALPLLACSRQESLVGLWAECEDLTCNQLVGKAILFTNDGLTYLAHEGGDPYDVPKGQYCRGDRPNSTYEVQGREVVLVLRDRTMVRFPFTVDKQFLTLEGASFYGETVKQNRETTYGELPPTCSG